LHVVVEHAVRARADFERTATPFPSR